MALVVATGSLLPMHEASALLAQWVGVALRWTRPLGPAPLSPPACYYPPAPGCYPYYPYAAPLGGNDPGKSTNN